MVKLLYLLSLMTVSFFTGCAPIMATVTANYNSALVQIDRPKETKERYGAIVNIKPESDNKYVYQDGLFVGVFYVERDAIHFVLTNKTEHSIKIVWDEAAFIDMAGQSGRVMHSGVKYADRNASQPPSVIAAQRSLTDFVIPEGNVYYDSFYSTWKHIGLVPLEKQKVAANRYSIPDSVATKQAKKKVGENIGKRFGLLLPLEIEGVVNEYTFWFEVQGASVSYKTGQNMKRTENVKGTER